MISRGHDARKASLNGRAKMNGGYKGLKMAPCPLCGTETWPLYVKRKVQGKKAHYAVEGKGDKAGSWAFAARPWRYCDKCQTPVSSADLAAKVAAEALSTPIG